MGVAISIVKQPPLLLKLYATTQEEVMFNV